MESTQDDELGVAAAATLYRALGDPTRRLIVQHLFNGPHRVRDLTDHLGLAQSTVSAHVACLRECGLVDAEPQGRATRYSLSEPERLTELLRATEGLLAATGAAVTLCRHLRADDAGSTAAHASGEAVESVGATTAAEAAR
ncbi:ArsR/SmtB family transcription factor [Cellulomonas gilvus]|uniref:Regulatory protein ArsR n=1 Tax=Cellulomonas gilvus (strain ATCC 13127 / NRRL B-14078) TaxID=593907 RepID=F8A723_CELGA|nr:metalloregulator ArsR/SmtB family transcription factor [Cellulomonas gilvus]AEI13510.1 regulatory protein ArsR [Cellulomonas gilvus ATCC 13127]